MDIEDLSACALHSSKITQPKQQATSQSFLYGIGLSGEDMRRPFVGISSCWIEGNPCNNHLNTLADAVKESVERVGGMNGMRFNTISISDAISMGTSGMRYSLLSREVIADSIETVTECLHYDANISLPSCDKNMPGVLIAQLRLNRPALVIYGGTHLVGTYKGERVDIGRASELYGEVSAGCLSEEDRLGIIRVCTASSGSCPGMFTANTMGVSIEAMGMSLPNSSSSPAVSREKLQECGLAGKTIKNLLVNNICPKDIITRKSLENAITCVCAVGGSTNAVLHLLAVAHTAGIPLQIDDFQDISDRTPYIGNFKPSGQFFMQDLHEIGGTSLLLKHLLDNGYLHGDCMTVTGNTLAHNLQSVKSLESIRQQIIFDVKSPKKATANLKILRGSLAPDGAVAKISGKEGDYFQGPAIVFDYEQDMLDSIAKGDIKKGMVVVIRYEGPKNGMPEMLYPTGALVGANLSQHCALITDGRFSGASHGFIIGHVTPEAYSGGPIALVENGDVITIDVANRKLELNVSEDILQRRRAAWKCLPFKTNQGVLRKFAKVVQSASLGCVTDY